MNSFHRRSFLIGTAASAAGLIAGTRSLSTAHAAGSTRQASGFYRYRLGDLVLTAVNDGVWPEPIDAAYVRNAPLAAVHAAMADASMPARDTLPLPFTALVVEGAAQRVLIDAGTGGQYGPDSGTLIENLRAAGIMPASIDMIAISHFHPDHIDGLKTKDDAIVFPNAEVLVPAPEWTYWMDDGNLAAAPEGKRKTHFLNARRIFANMGDRVRRFAPGTDIAPGIVSLPAFGHTPGHTVFAVTSGAASMLALGDTTRHPALFVRHPEWQGGFDIDGDMAVATRRRLLDRVAADRMLVAGYHFPFPATGHIVRRRTAFDFAPLKWDSAP